MDFTLLVVIAVVAIALLWFAKVVDRGGTESVVETESRSGANEPAGGCERRICHGRASPVASLPDGKPVVNEDAVTILLDRMKKYGMCVRSLALSS